MCRAKRKATVSRLLQQAIWKRSFFMCGLFFRGPQPSALQSSGIPPFFDSSSSDFLCAFLLSQQAEPLFQLVDLAVGQQQVHGFDPLLQRADDQQVG